MQICRGDIGRFLYRNNGSHLLTHIDLDEPLTKIEPFTHANLAREIDAAPGEPSLVRENLRIFRFQDFEGSFVPFRSDESETNSLSPCCVVDLTRW
jgi:hypothetical protein